MSESRFSLNPLPVPDHAPIPTVSSSPSTSHIAKRKRNGDSNQEAVGLRLPRHKKARKSKQEDDENLDVDLGLNLAIGKLDSRLLADYVAQRIQRFSHNLSLVELDDLHLSGSIIIETSSCRC